MSKLADIVAALHEGLAEHLLEHLQGGEPTPQMLEIARKFLKDNGVDDIPKENSALGKLANLEVFDKDDPDGDAVTH